MISVSNVTLRIGKKALFEDVNIKFTEGNCYGLIGANGAGKSTFLKILSGNLETTKGDVIITPGQRLSVLEQDHFKYDDYSVMDTVIMGNERLYQIMKEKDAIYAKEDFTDEDGIRASELEGEFAELDGWEAESSASMLLNGLGVETELHYSTMRDLDGSVKVKVLLAKANALLRRSSALPADTINAGKISILAASHKVFLDGKEITLTYKEYELLRFFMSNPGQIFSREQLLNRIWGYDFEGTTRTVDTHIKTLRQKLGDEGRHIVTLIRSGYKFEVTV